MVCVVTKLKVEGKHKTVFPYKFRVYVRIWARFRLEAVHKTFPVNITAFKLF